MTTIDDVNQRAEVQRRLSEAILETAQQLRTLAPKSSGAVKSVESYADELATLVQNFLRGGSRLSKGDFRREMKALIKEEAYQIAEDAFGDLDGLSNKDQQIVKEFISEQQSHVNDFSDWLRSKESDLDDAPSRIGSWVASMDNFQERMEARAIGNPRLEFYGDDGEDGCDECAEMNGQVHTLEWWQGDNPDGVDYTARQGNTAFTCGRWSGRCNHGFRNVKTVEVVIS